MAGGEEHYTVSLKGKPAGDMAAALSSLPGVSDLEKLAENGSARFKLTAEKGADLSEKIFDCAVSGGMKMLELNHVSTSLEDVFIKLTSHHAGETTGDTGGADNG